MNINNTLMLTRALFNLRRQRDKIRRDTYDLCEELEQLYKDKSYYLKPSPRTKTKRSIILAVMLLFSFITISN